MKKEIIASVFCISLLFTSCNVKKTTAQKSDISKPELKVYVGANTDICNYAFYMAVCMPVKFEDTSKDNPSYLQAENGIEDFFPQIATEYELLVSREEIPNPPADGASVKYKLIKVLSEKKVVMDDIVHNIVRNQQTGQSLALTFNNTKGFVKVRFEGMLLELKDNHPASGIWYSDEHYELRGKADDIELLKDGKVIFNYKN